MYKAKIFIGSTKMDGDNHKIIKNPYTFEPVTEVPETSIDLVNQALTLAEKAKLNCKNSMLSQRINWLKDVADKLSQNIDEFAKIITDEVGKPIAFSKVEVQRCIETIELTIQAVSQLNGETINTDAANSGRKAIAFYKRVPVGVIVAITPFNFPLNLVAHKLAPAIAAGNAVILKPTPEAPYTAYCFAKLFIDSPYAIKDALSIVYGDAEVGNALVKSEIPRVISFTGSATVGKIIMQNAGIKKVSLELGGNAATFIEKSADINIAAKRCAFGAFSNSGQVCISLQRIYVDAKIYDDFASILAEETSQLKVGSPYDEATFMGPLINEDAVNRANNWVEDAINQGAKALTGNKSESRIFYPTVMADVTEDMSIVCEEVFAPIVSLIKVNDFDEALSKMNDSPYGLQFSVFTNNLNVAARAVEELEAGGIVINDIPTLRFDIQPYGGIKNSGVGKEGPQFALEEFTEIKSVVILS